MMNVASVTSSALLSDAITGAATSVDGGSMVGGSVSRSGSVG